MMQQEGRITHYSNYMMQQERRITHYSNYHKILLVGEGDFSFSASLATAFGSAVCIVATSMDTLEMVMSKYPNAWINLETLRRLGGTILHGVNVHFMSRHLQLCGHEFDRIIYNFPHAGFSGSLGERNTHQIERHREVVRGFFRNARTMLGVNDEIHVTHKTSSPFSEWEIQGIAWEEGLRCVGEVEFRKYNYPGYENKKGDGIDCNDTFPVGRCSTFKFAL